MPTLPETAFDRFLYKCAKLLAIKLPRNIRATSPPPIIQQIVPPDPQLIPPPSPVVERVRLMSPLGSSIEEEIIDPYDQISIELYMKIQKQLKRHKEQSQKDFKQIYDNQLSQAKYAEDTRKMMLQVRHA